MRISPHELHVSDPDFYGTLYTGSTNARDKYGWNARQFGTSSSTFGTIAHARHRTRRAAVNPFFSRQTVLRQTPLIWSKVQRLCERIEEHRQSKEPLNLRDAFSALTIDIITQYCFNQPHGCLDHADFMPQWPRGIMEASAASHLNKQFGWLLPLLMMLPESAVEKSSPNMMSVIRLRNVS